MVSRVTVLIFLVGLPEARALGNASSANLRRTQALEEGAVFPADQAATFTVSEPGTVALLTRIPALGTPSPAGRSYDGNAWEAVQPTPLNFDCVGVDCIVFLPEYNGPTEGESYTYQLNILDGPVAATTEQMISRFLRHSTFGPTKPEIDAFMGGATDVDAAMQAWIDAQIAEPVSLHRAHYRRRANGRWRWSGSNGKNAAAELSSPCELGSRWTPFAFTETDERRTLTVTANSAGGYDLLVEGVLRTQVDTFDLTAFESNSLICWVVEKSGGSVVLGSSTTCTQANDANLLAEGVRVAGPLTISNPPIAFSEVPVGASVFTAAEATVVAMENEHDADCVILQNLSATCTPPPVGTTDFFMSIEGQYYRHDPRIRLLENSLETPATNLPPSGPIWSSSYGGPSCPTAPKTFLNKNTCVRRPECTSPPTYSDTWITLDETNIRSFYEQSKLFVFRAVGIDQFNQYSGSASPCTSNWHSSTHSRWLKTSGQCTQDTALNEETLATITAALTMDKDCYSRHIYGTGYGSWERCVPSNNAMLKDINAPGQGTCNDPAAQGASITIDGNCWTHTHKDMWNVVDFTLVQPYMPSGIKNYVKMDPHHMVVSALNGETDFDVTQFDQPEVPGLYNYPSEGAGWTGTRYWADMSNQVSDKAYQNSSVNGPGYRNQMRTLGRFGDTINFADLAAHLQTPELAALWGATANEPEYDGTEACGSPGEVASVAEYGHRYPSYAGYRMGVGGGYPDYMSGAALNNPGGGGIGNNKQTVWHTLAQNAPDQLRQRAAWAFSQIFALGVITTTTMHTIVEHWTVFYDIFVRHGLGNYRDLLKEVAYNPLMGLWLTFINNKGYAASGTYPDENFAREVLELFSIGLHNLDEFGTKIVDEVGNPVPSYDNHDIMSTARAWTGFRRRGMRSNIEQRMGLGNYIDPMSLKASWRDANPKVDLLDGYFGDKRPLCVDLPEKAFLRTGATYVYRGHKMPPSPQKPIGQWWNTDDPANMGSLPSASTSQLYQTLCSADESGACTWPSEVTLMSKLECDGDECLVDTVRVIKVVWGAETIYYEYKPVECVRHVFYDDAKQIKAGRAGHNQGKVMCADPRLPVAGAACCSSPTTYGTMAQARCQYAREYVSFATAQSRCEIATNQYNNQYDPFVADVVDHYVSHGNNIYWHIYPQVQPDCMSGAFLQPYSVATDHTIYRRGWSGCGSAPACQNDEGGPSESCPGNQNFISACKSPHEAFNVHCCSDTPIAAQEGDWENQTYTIAPGGQCANQNTYPGTMMGNNYPDGKPYSNGVITNFANIGEHCGANPTCVDTDISGSVLEQVSEDDSEPQTVNTDVQGNGCTWYATDAAGTGTPEQCGDFDHVGFYANEMCCACGGGVPPQTEATCDGCVHAATYDEAVAACAADGARLCTRWEVEAECNYQAGCDGDNTFVWTSTECTATSEFMCDAFDMVDGPGYCQSKDEWTWTSRSCQLQIQVDVSGYVWLVNGGDLRSGDSIYGPVALDNLNAFRVPWADADDATVGGPGNFPHSGDNCANSGCEKVGFTCLCTPDVTTTAVFDTMTAPTYGEVLEQLKNGAPNPTIFDAGTYALHASSTADVEVWQPTANAGSYDTATIFKIEYPAGTDLYLANQDSQVTMGAFSFRNPPNHVLASQPSVFDAEYETDAVIDHIAEHPNTPVFIARMLILRMTTSNPSPRYIKAVGDAFRTGTHGGVTYTGNYGDLSATFAAILLDREARSTTLEADPNHGKLREPLLKVVGLMRSMQYADFKGNEIAVATGGLEQAPYTAPSVFNFYQPDFQSVGGVSDANLASPEAQLLSPPHFVEYLNNIVNLINMGLFNGGCGGFGHGIGTSIGSAFGSAPQVHVESYSGCTPHGKLNFVPTSGDSTAAVDELDLLLTGGRMSSTNKAYITTVYEDTISFGGCVPPGSDAHYTSIYSRNPVTDHPCTGEAGVVHVPALDTEIYPVVCCSETFGLESFSDGTQDGQCAAYNANPSNVPVYSSAMPFGSGVTFSGTWAEAKANCESFSNETVEVRMCSMAEVNGRCAFKAGGSWSLNWVYGWISDVPPNPAIGATKAAQRLIVSTADYSSDTSMAERSDVARDAPMDIPFLNRGYKAVVIIFCYGGLDSYNVLVPHSDCPLKDMYAEYAEVRGPVTLPESSLQQISVPAGTQPCGTFGLHPKIPRIKTMYDEGEALFVANIGTLLAPITAYAYHSGEALIPKELASHKGQTRAVQNVHSQHTGAKGILGRIVDGLQAQSQPYRSFAYSIAGNAVAVQGGTSAILINKNNGIPQLNSYDARAPAYYDLAAQRYNSIFAETFAGMLEAALLQTNSLGDLLKNNGVAQSNLQTNFDNRDLSKQMYQVAKVISIRNDPAIQSERDMFYTKIGGFDSHQNSGSDLNHKLEEIDIAVKDLADEMKAQGLWENITIVTLSDFGRTLTSNGIGTDHAWGGHNIIIGGEIAGAQIMGNYPNDLMSGPEESLSIGRGRMIPTTPWEGIWYGIAQWLDVADDQMGIVIPNIGSWNVGDTLFTSGQMYASTGMVAAPIPEPEPMPTSTDLTTGTLNGECYGIWRLITPAGQSVAIPTCVIPDPSVLPACVTTYISLSGDIVTIGSPNTPTYDAFVGDFATDMAASLGVEADQIEVNGISAGSRRRLVAIGDGSHRSLQDSEIVVDFTVTPSIVVEIIEVDGVQVEIPIQVPVAIETITEAFSAPNVAIGGLVSTSIIDSTSIVMYAASCPATTLAQITSPLAACCDETLNGVNCSTSTPTSCSTGCNDVMMPFWNNCSATILGMDSSHFVFDAPAMEEFLNGHCTDGLGTLTTDTGASVAEAAAIGFIHPVPVPEPEPEPSTAAPGAAAGTPAAAAAGDDGDDTMTGIIVVVLIVVVVGIFFMRNAEDAVTDDQDDKKKSKKGKTNDDADSEEGMTDVDRAVAAMEMPAGMSKSEQMKWTREQKAKLLGDPSVMVVNPLTAEAGAPEQDSKKKKKKGKKGKKGKKVNNEDLG